MNRAIERWNKWLPGTFVGLTKQQQIAERAEYDLVHEKPSTAKRRQREVKRTEFDRRRAAHARKSGVRRG